MLVVNTNTSSINAFNSIRTNQSDVTRGFERLSSGLRINGARDDAAGLSISTRMTAQVRGAQQATRNANDAISYLQTAEGALEETTNILQRMRELSVQSGNETLNSQDRSAIQEELNQLMSELDRINETTNFNTQSVFSQHKTVSLKQTYANGGNLNHFAVDYNESEDLSGHALGQAEAETRRDFVVDGMKSGWLQQSERMIEEDLGIIGDNDTIAVDFVDGGDGANGTLAFVGGNDPIRLHIDLNDFDNINSPDGGASPLYSDRIIAHEMVHAVMNANNISQFDDDKRWFNEGVAELLHGAADTRLASTNVATYQSGGLALANAFDGPLSGGIDYSEAYVAAAYLHQEVIDNGGQGIKDILQDMAGGSSLNTAIGANTGFTGTADYQATFQTIGEGDVFAANLRQNFVNTGDTGSISGSFFGGSVLDAESVVANNTYSTSDKKGGQRVEFHIGGNAEDELKMYVGSFNVDAMGLREIDVTDHQNVDFAIAGLSDALNYVSSMRSELGAMQNRLGTTVNSLQINVENTSASRSRITDADFAEETSKLTKAQIIQQASVSMLSQTNIQPQLALSLL